MQKLLFVAASLSLAFLFLIFGGLVALGFLAESGVEPEHGAIRGERLRPDELRFLVERGVLPSGDRVLWFFCEDPETIESDGNFFTEEHVVAYWIDEDDRFASAASPFSSVSDIGVELREGEGENSVVHVTTDEVVSFEIFVSNSQGHDREFVAELLERWRAERDPALLDPRWREPGSDDRGL